MIPRADYDASAVIPSASGIFRESTRDYFHRCCIDRVDANRNAISRRSNNMGLPF
jgi:hypothetical protein